MTRRVGPKIIAPGQTEFSLWAPDALHVALAIEGETRRLDMRRGADDMWLRRAEFGAGTRYTYLIDGGEKLPDPASHAQAADRAWRQHRRRSRLCLAKSRLARTSLGRRPSFTNFIPAPLAALPASPHNSPAWRKLGITAIELMPIADFPGKRNWGYDGVLPFAPATRLRHAR